MLKMDVNEVRQYCNKNSGISLRYLRSVHRSPVLNYLLVGCQKKKKKARWEGMSNQQAKPAYSALTVSEEIHLAKLSSKHLNCLLNVEGGAGHLGRI